MPNKWTFLVPPIADLLDRYKEGRVWADPFSGQSIWADHRNDLNPENTNAHSHRTALEFLQGIETGAVGGVVFDPPYSIHQVKVAYDDMGIEDWHKDNATGGFYKERDEVSRILLSGGLAISFGWNTVGMGKTRGFQAIEHLIVSHGGNRNDTLVTVEVKL